jgi:FAD synthetase
LFVQALRQAQAFGSEPQSRRGKPKEDVELVVIVGRDSACVKWKGKKPKRSHEQRLNLVKAEKNVGNAVLGDEEQSSYKVLEGLNPDVICLGYDQDKLAQDLQIWMQKTGMKIPLYWLDGHYPEKYHNSVL